MPLQTVCLLIRPPRLTDNTASTTSSQQLEPGMASTILAGPAQTATTSQKHSVAQKPQGVKQQQSLALVQIMLHASFGTLFYLREFLPLSCFGECDLHTLSLNHPAPSYTDFIHGNTAQPAELERRGQPLKVIPRGRDAKADHILDLLEHGVFDALHKSVLEAVQLTVFVDKEAPSQVLESYTFSFAYTSGVKELDTRLASVSLKTAGTTTEVKTFRTAKAGLEMIIRRLITLSAFLPILPDKRYLGIHLVYTDDCPSAYEPPGFNSTTDEHFLFPCSRDWSKETQSCGIMDSGSHTVGLTVTSLKWSGEEDQDKNRRFPNELEYQEVVARENDIGIGPPGQSDVIEEKSYANSLGSTQACHDAMGKAMLQKMLSSSVDSDVIPTQVKPCSDVESETTKPELSQLRLRQLQEKKLQVQAGNSVICATGDNDEIICQCGWNGQEDSDIIQCEFCEKWQHLTCYGFLRLGDKNIPDVHVCYKCLLEPDETNILREMDTLVLLRRALKIIIEDGFTNVRDFSQKLHCDSHTVVQVTDLLKKQGYLCETPGSKKKGFARTGLPKFTIPNSEKVKQRLREEIFNPWVKLTHHYIIPISQLGDKDKLLHNISPPDQTQRAKSSSLLEPTSHDDSQTDDSGCPTTTSPLVSARCSSGHGKLKPRPRLTTSTRFLRPSSAKNESNPQALDNYRPRKKRKLSNAYPVDVGDPMD